MPEKIKIGLLGAGHSHAGGKLRVLEEAGLTIVERVSIQVEEPEKAGGYLRTKKEKLGHLIEFLKE